MMRLQKWISQLGIASRREAENWITEGRISVNGKPVRDLGSKISPGEDQIKIDGKLISSEPPPKVYWLLHKPDMVLTSRRNDTDKPTIYELPRLKKTSFLVSPVGRLDFRTEGLLLMTNDGELANRLTHPNYKLPRHYYALISSRLEKSEENQIRNGVRLKDGPVKGVLIKHIHGQKLGASKGSWYSVTVFEGRNRLVRRIFEKFDKKVIKLIRYGFGDLRLPEDLKPGDYKQLSSDEIAKLRRSADLK
jgi:23S rRNA pseudouridine2605 synthase